MFKLKKQKQLPRSPRILAEIQKEYAALAHKIAQANYQVYIHNRALDEYNLKMYDLNQEADQRTKLDAVKPKEESDVKS